MEAENQLLRKEVAGSFGSDLLGGSKALIARSAAMRAVLEMFRRVAPAKANVLITGENGTGKGVVARALHGASDCADRPFITINMGVILGTWVGCVVAARGQILFPLRTLSNLLAALREGDYSLRAASARRADALDEVMRELNGLSPALQTDRQEATETNALLLAMISNIDLAVFTFDEESRLRLMLVCPTPRTSLFLSLQPSPGVTE